MIRKNMLLIVCFFIPSLFLSQTSPKNHIIGASLGFSFLGSVPQYGLNYEYPFNKKELGFDNAGVIGIGGIFRYWNYSENFINVDWEYKNVILGAQINYHFYMADDNIDPWLGLVVAYNFSSSDAKIKTVGFEVGENSNNGIWAGANAGVRYWLSEKTAINLRIGFGSLSYGAIDFGFDYKLK